MKNICKVCGKRRTAVFGRVLSAVIAVLALSLAVYILRGTSYALLFLMSAFIHEAGHMVAAKLFNVRRVRLDDVFSLSVRYDFSGSTFFAEAAVSAAGALFNVIACILCFALGKAATLNGVFFVFSNSALAMFNLMPISPLDGFGIITSLMSEIFPPNTVSLIAKTVSVTFSLAFFLLTVYIQLKVGASLSLAVLSVLLCLNIIGKEKGGSGKRT